jgi:hypothetical protein
MHPSHLKDPAPGRCAHFKSLIKETLANHRAPKEDRKDNQSVSLSAGALSVHLGPPYVTSWRDLNRKGRVTFQCVYVHQNIMTYTLNTHDKINES